MTGRSQSFIKKFLQERRKKQGYRRHLQETTLHPKRQIPAKIDVAEEGECTKEGCTGREKRHYPSTSRTRSGGHKNERNPHRSHSTGNRSTQEANHTHRGVMQEGKGAQSTPRVHDY
jgi:hypothetical protein